MIKTATCVRERCVLWRSRCSVEKEHRELKASRKGNAKPKWECEWISPGSNVDEDDLMMMRNIERKSNLTMDLWR